MFSADPRKDHDIVMIYLGIYLNHIKLIGIKFKIQTDKGFECYANTNFPALFVRNTLMWTAFVTSLDQGGPSKLQTIVALSITKMITLSNALCISSPSLKL